MLAFAGEVKNQSDWKSFSRNRWWDCRVQLLQFEPTNDLCKFANKDLDQVSRYDYDSFVKLTKSSVKKRPVKPWFYDLDANVALSDSDLLSVWYERFERKADAPGIRSVWVHNFAMIGGKPERAPLAALFGYPNGNLPADVESALLEAVNKERDLNGAPVLPSYRSEIGACTVVTRSALVILASDSLVGSTRDQVHKLYVPLATVIGSATADSPIQKIAG